MHRPQTALSICNIALGELGESPIAGIDPNGNLAQRLCWLNYHPTRREVLCAAPWSFAKAEADIASRVPADGVQTLPHDIPQEAIRILTADAKNWRILGRAIYCPEPVVHITYTADNEAIETWSEDFIEAFTARLCAKLSIPLLCSEHKQAYFLQRFSRIISLANK